MFQEEQVSILIITLVLAIFFIWAGRQVKSLKENKRPSKLVAAIVEYVSWIYNYTVTSMGPVYGPKFSAYIGSIFIYILVANISGLFGLSAPTANLSVTLVLALITWISIQVVSIRTNGLKGYIKGYFEPFAFFVIPNVFGEIAPLISLSLRLFGNIIAGSVIMSLVYMFTSWLASFVPIIGNFNFIGVIVAPVLHLYFDLFSGFLQSFLFISLTMIFIGVEAPAFNKKDVKTIKKGEDLK